MRRIAGAIVWLSRQVQVGPCGCAAQRAQRHGPCVDEQQARARQLARQQRAWQALQRDLEIAIALRADLSEGVLTGFLGSRRARQLARQQRAWQALQRDSDTTLRP